MPHDVGRPAGDEAQRHPRLDDLLQTRVVGAGVAPAAVVFWARRAPEGTWRAAVGAAGCGPDAIFDLASVTKPLTALAAMQLASAGTLPLAATVGELLPELGRANAAGARLDDLLAHRAGLPAWGALYRRDPWGATTAASLPPDLDDDAHPAARARMVALAASRIDRRAIGFAVPPQYSDLGYVLAGEMIARAAGVPLAELWERLAPPYVLLGSAERLRVRLGEGFDRRVVPSEHVPWRSGDVRGVVHDENAFMLQRAGGQPGHAGAFGTAAAVGAVSMRFVDALGSMRGDQAILPRALAEQMIAPRPSGSHLLGWDGVTRGASSSGARFGPRAFGHLGFTGTSVWADPDAGAVAVLLTNRTYPTRDNVRIRAARPLVHDALWEIDPAA